MGSGFESYKPALSMIVIQAGYAGLALLTRQALVDGMNPRVLIVYRQAIATLFITPIACFSSSRKEASNRSTIGLRSFSLIFISTFIGVTLSQNVYFEGLYLASSSAASAAVNLIPAITFVMAAALGLEKVKGNSVRSIAKITGTIICVIGAVSMALLKGPKLLNIDLLPVQSISIDNWLLGCIFLFACATCWSIWLILQVAVTTIYPDHISLSAWTCFISTIQSTIVAFLLERDPEVWKIHSVLELVCCLYAGIICSGFSYIVQAWCIAKRGPVFSSMFNPLCTVIVTVLASIILHEEIYTGSMIGAILVIFGLYVVLWGKAKDLQENTKRQTHHTCREQDSINEQVVRTDCKIDLEEPLWIINK